jgi:hypothetical protein
MKNKFLLLLTVLTLALSTLACGLDLGTPAPAIVPTVAPPTTVQILNSNGYVYDSSDVDYKTYFNIQLGLTALVYGEHEISFCILLRNDIDISSQITVTMNTIKGIFGPAVMGWIVNTGSQLDTVGQEITGSIDGYNIDMYVDVLQSGVLYEGIIIEPAGGSGSSY